MVRTRPKVSDVFRAEDPGLFVRAVGDRRADLGIAIRIGGVIPLVVLASFDAACEIVEIMDASRQFGVKLRQAIASIGERRVPVDADGNRGRTIASNWVGRIDSEENPSNPCIRWNRTGIRRAAIRVS